MGRPTLPLVVLTAALVLAGCSGFAGDRAGGNGTERNGVEPPGEGDSGVTPAPVPTIEGTETPRRLAPGLLETGVSDPGALLAAHRTVVEGEPYTVRAVVNATYTNGTTYYRSVVTARVAEGGERYDYTGTLLSAAADEGDRARYERWSDGRTTLTASLAANATAEIENASEGTLRADGNVTYRRIPVEFGRNAEIHDPPPYSERIDEQIGGAETVVRDRTDAVGPTYYIVSLTGARDLSAFADGRFRNVQNVSGRFLVSPEGFIREYRVTFTATSRSGKAVRVIESITYSSVGWTTVERPPWYDEALNATNGTGTAGEGHADYRRLSATTPEAN